MTHVKHLVLGAGISGLCTGFYLQRHFGAADVLVAEAGPAPGGTARTDADDGFLCEWGPNGFLDREPLTLQWVEDLGIADQLLRANERAAKRFLYRNGQLHQLVGPPKFMLRPILSIPGRLRLLCEPLIPAKRDGTPETIHDFAARRIGKEAADYLVGPMVAGVFGGDAKQLSLEHCFPRMAAMERDHGGLFKALQAKKKSAPGASPMGPGGTLTGFDGGMAALITAAASALGDRLLCNKAATRVRRDADRFVVDFADGSTINADHLVLAVPSYVAAELLAALNPHTASALASIPYAGIAVVSTGFRREDVGHSLDGFGFLAPRNEGLRLLGSIWTSSIFPNQAPEGHVLLRTMIGGATDPEAATLSSEALRDIVLRELTPLLDLKAPPVLTKVFQWTRGIPQYTLGHATRLSAVDRAEEEYAGLVFAGNAYRGVGVNDCVVSAHRAVARLTEGVPAEAGTP